MTLEIESLTPVIGTYLCVPPIICHLVNSMTQLTINQRHIVARFMDATSLEIEQGNTWYLQAFNVCKRISLEYGVNAELVAAVFAALSPNNKWERNVKDAENVIAAYMLGGVDDALAVRVCTYGKNLAKAVDILNSCHCRYEELLNGPKIIEFYHCIIGEPDVCIDGHAYSVWFGERLTMKQVPNIGKKLRQQIKTDYKVATDFINQNSTDEFFTAAQVQAITWVAHKRLHGV